MNYVVVMSWEKVLANVCLLHRCTTCCQRTEMPLTSEDIERITGLGYHEDSFIVESGGLRRLRNIRGSCFFLDNGCKIYPNRPEGCALYPTVYDAVGKRAVLDEDCPYQREFHVSFKKSKRVSQLYTTLTSLE